MSQQKPPPVPPFLDTFTMTNWTIRMAWRATAGLVAIMVRIIAGVIRTIARIGQRNRDW